MKKLNLLLLNSDGTDSSSVADPLSTPTSDIDISRDVATAANYEMTIKEAKLVDKKDDPTRKNLVITLKSTKETRSTKGSIMAPGALTLSKYYPTAATEKMDIRKVAQGFARLAKGVGLSGGVTPKGIIDNPSILVGKTAIWKVAIKQETSEFPEGNEIKDVVIPD